MEQLQRAVHQLEARTRRNSPSPLFILAIGALIGAVIATLTIPRHDGGTGTALRAGRGGSGDAASSDLGGATSGDAALSGSGDAASGASGSAAGGATGGSAASGGSAGGGRAAGSAASGPNNGGIRGVTATSVKIGLFCVDTSAFKSIDPGYYTGPCKDYINAQVQDIQKKGQDVINGRKVQYVVRPIDVTHNGAASAQQGDCDQWAQQDQLFAVGGDYTGYPCFAQQYHGVTINWSPTYALDQAQLSSFGPYFFQVGTVLDQIYRNLVAWGDTTGRLKGKRIGIHYPSSYPSDLVQNVLIGSLHAHGYPTCANLTSTNCIAATTSYNLAPGDLSANSAQPDNEVAIQKYISAKVDMVLMLEGAAAGNQFTHDAQQQNFHPKYVGFDDTLMTSDSVSQYYDPDQYNLTPAVTFYRYGERNAGVPLDDSQARCISNYENYAHTKLDYRDNNAQTTSSTQKPESPPWQILMDMCDVINALQAGLQAAGHTLTPDTLKNALEHLPPIPTDSINGLGWSPTRHWGGNAVDELAWHRECLCYLRTTTPVPPYSP
jgi:hypothetical protein